MTPEIATYLERLNAIRAKMLETLEGLKADELNWTPLAQDTNSLFVLATHSLGAEHGWIGELVGDAPRTRVREREFLAKGSSVQELKQAFDANALETERVLSGLTEEDLSKLFERPSDKVTVRWMILHVIEHYSEHLGQMTLTRQLWEHRG